ncbi:MAG: MFS transporter [Clostridiaceae bacterium]|nr:MFS transporter [Clostridiaceae bacterium]
MMKSIKELKSFLILWISQTVSELGTAMTNFALTIWVYQKSGSVLSLTLLTLCSFLPTILFRFFAGAVADRWDKKRILLIADSVAACGTLVILGMYSASVLEVWHLYLINILLSLMNSFQVPASFVATSLLVPKEHYTRASGLQGISNAVISILAPALGSAILAFGGMQVVFVVDIASFAIAFFVLMFLIRIPKTERPEKQDESVFKSCMDGIRFLKEHKSLFHLTLFIAVINFLAKIGGDGMESAFILARTNGNQQVLGIVQSATAFGLFCGSVLVTVMKPVKKKARLVFLATGILFAGDVLQSLMVSPLWWSVVLFVTYAIAVIMNANLTTIMREKVPIEMQGRVFSAQDTLKNCTIPLGLFLGGFLADHVFEPFMSGTASLQKLLSFIWGSGAGAGIALLFFVVGILGMGISFARLGKRVYEDLNE